MRKLDTKSRALIIRLLVEGNSIRATSRIADVSRNTVNKLLIDAGKACAKYHDENVRNVKASVIQCGRCLNLWSLAPLAGLGISRSTPLSGRAPL